MPKKKIKSSAIKKLQEITSKTNELCKDDDEETDDDEYRGRSSNPVTGLSGTSKNCIGDASPSHSSDATSLIQESIRKELRDNDISDLSEIFTIFDVQNSGNISFQDLLRSLRFLRFSLDENELKEILKSLLCPKEENFSREIFLYCVIECQNRMTDWTKQIVNVFDEIDVTKKGGINLDDLKSVNKVKNVELNEKDVYEMMMSADLNEDGIVDKHEFINIMLQTNLFQ